MQGISSQIEPKKEQLLKFLSCLLCSMGAHYRKGNDPTTQQDFEIKRIIMHEHYKKPFGMSNDIALLKLSTPAMLNKRVGLACLPDKSVDLPINDINKKCWITGMKCFFNPVQRDVSGYRIKKLPVLHPKSSMRLNVTDPVQETLKLLQSGCPVLFVNIAEGDYALKYFVPPETHKSHLAHDLAGLGSRRCIMHRIRIFNFPLDNICEALRLVFD